MVNRKLDIKTVDFTKLTSPGKFEEAAVLIRNECENSGFFLVKVPENVEKQMPNVLEAAKRFFELPLKEKQKLDNNELTQFRINGKCIPGTGAGYRGFSEDPNFALDTRESFNMGPDVSKSLVTSVGYSGSGMTPWPEETVLTGWRSVMKTYCDSLLEISCTLRQLFAVALGLDRAFFEKPGYFDKESWLLGLVHYSASQSNEEKGIFGIKPHSDGGMFTLLLGDGNSGLQICPDKSVEYNDRIWLDIEPPPPGHLIVNLGQILERWTNGKFKATLHRVVLTGETERFSVPFFYEPNVDCVIEPIFGSSPDGKYSATTCGKIFLERLNKSIEEFE